MICCESMTSTSIIVFSDHTTQLMMTGRSMQTYAISHEVSTIKQSKPCIRMIVFINAPSSIQPQYQRLQWYRIDEFSRYSRRTSKPCSPVEIEDYQEVYQHNRALNRVERKPQVHRMGRLLSKPAKRSEAKRSEAKRVGGYSM